MNGTKAVVAFYFDAGSGVGLGHAMRCAALAEAFREQGHLALAAGPPDGAAIHLTGDLFQWRRPESGCAVDAAPERWACWLKGQGATIVIIDSYRIRPETLGALRSAGLYVVYLDDHNAFPMDVQLVINAGLAAERETYRFQRAGRALLGAPYTLLRRRVVEARRLREQRERFELQQPQQILVTLGGGDPMGHLPRVLEALDRVVQSGCCLEAHVIVGPYMDFPEEFKEKPWIRRHHPPTDIISMLPAMDLAVTAAGVTLQELLATGVPCAVVVQADNQVPAALAACQMEAALPLFSTGPPGAPLEKGNQNETVVLQKPLEIEEIARRLFMLLHEQKRAQALGEMGKNIIDGLGALRCCREVLEDARRQGFR
ncbi:hypothetical protein GTO91_06905 [Heliobacterium undosum]|uniref:UDP-2,4-diacetamido-2,4, 6-trideoxy-beta-L-altropyranose hydrolase n=1 Tax=Heliomicrobium undosum TaxID=121734 RepID=A0A845KZD8_9FIRM|nr:hypothetical protein [Heliomicrobium undosum]MZP29432.1 hypothetical protein [Heliomicrobium undosum]